MSLCGYVPGNCSSTGLCQTAVRPLLDGLVCSVENTFSRKTSEIHPEVKVFAYSLHVTDAMVERETGQALLFRRSRNSWTFRSTGIMKLTASDLAALLTAYGVSMPKSSTNANKIRGLMRTDEVRSQTSEAERNRVEDILSTQEAKRKKKAKRDDEPEPVDDEDEQAISHMRRR